VSERCPTCDREGCQVAATTAHAATVTIPVTPGENGCNCYGYFSRSGNPSRGCRVHGEESPALRDARNAQTGAWNDCQARAVDWRARCLAAEAGRDAMRPVVEAAVHVRVYTEETGDGHRCVARGHRRGKCVDCDFLRAVDAYRARKETP